MDSTIVEIRQETHDVKTFRLKLSGEISFIPGQYCLVTIGGDSRPFTFTNSPTEKNHVELTVKKMGKFTTMMHNLKAGEKIGLSEPKGEKLNFDESVKQDIVLLAGGSGITPFISYIRYALAKQLPNQIYLLFNNRTEKDIIYKDELKNIKKDNIRAVNILSDEISDTWKGEKGRITKEIIEKYVPEPKNKIWYICGPPPMVDAMKKILSEMGIPENNWRVEDWQIAGKHDG